MSRKVFNAGEILTASDVNNFLMDQSVMSFASAAARTTAIPSPVEGMLTWLEDVNRYDSYNGTAWVPLVPESQGNAIINGAFDIWQRGTSISNFGFFSLYTSDRWIFNSTNTGRTISRQPTNDTTNLPDIQFCARVQRDSGNSLLDVSGLSQSLETANSIPFVGKRVTFSFYARAGANYSATSNALVARVISGTGTDQNAVNGFTGSVALIDNSATLTTTWQRFTYSATVPTNSRQLAVFFRGTPTGTAGANDWFEVTGVQLEAGSAATPFRRNANSLQGELAACQRYYQRISVPSDREIAVGFAANTTQIRFYFDLTTSMRIPPNAIDSGSNWIGFDGAGSVSISALVLGSSTPSTFLVLATSAGNTQFRPYSLYSTGTTFIGFSAEL
jgi:hypothetical protein